MNPFKQGQRVRFKHTSDLRHAKYGVVTHVSRDTVDVMWDGTQYQPPVTAAYHYSTLTEVKEDHASQ